ncbi:unnamed protein product [Closterium sp. Naga37s-1]|nr:unnamed protein product [Closterium sp. Naga37s-1]
MSVVPRESVQVAAHSIGIASLGDDVAAALAPDVEYRMREIIQARAECGRMGRGWAGHGWGRREYDGAGAGRAGAPLSPPLTSRPALSLRNVEPLFGLAAADSVRFRRAVGHSDVVFLHDPTLPLSQVVEARVPCAPADVSVAPHWLAVDGTQPATPENAPPAVRVAVGDDYDDAARGGVGGVGAVRPFDSPASHPAAAVWGALRCMLVIATHTHILPPPSRPLPPGIPAAAAVKAEAGRAAEGGTQRAAGGAGGGAGGGEGGGGEAAREARALQGAAGKHVLSKELHGAPPRPPCLLLASHMHPLSSLARQLLPPPCFPLPPSTFSSATPFSLFPSLCRSALQPLYFERVTELVLLTARPPAPAASSVPTPGGQQHSVLCHALRSVAVDAGLHALLPYFVHFIADEASPPCAALHALFSSPSLHPLHCTTSTRAGLLSQLPGQISPETKPSLLCSVLPRTTSRCLHHSVLSSRLLIFSLIPPAAAPLSGDALTGRLLAAGQPHAPRQGAAAQPAPPHGAIPAPADACHGDMCGGEAPGRAAAPHPTGTSGPSLPPCSRSSATGQSPTSVRCLERAEARTFGRAYASLQPRLTRTLLHTLLDPKRSLPQHFGAIRALTALGPTVPSFHTPLSPHHALSSCS